MLVVRCRVAGLSCMSLQVWKVCSNMLCCFVVFVTHVLLIFQVPPVFINLKSIFYEILGVQFDRRLVFTVIFI